MKSFTIYEEYFDLVGLLNRRESEELSWAIWEYMFQDKIPKLNDKQMKIFNNLKRPLDKSKNKSRNTSNQNQNEIKMKSNNNQNKIKTKTHQDVNVNVYVDRDNRGMGEEEKDILDFIEKHEMIITPNDYERLKYFITKIPLEQIKDSLLAGNGKTFNYTMKILQAKLEEQKHKHKENEPEWFNKKIVSEKISEKEKKEFEEFVKEFQ